MKDKNDSKTSELFPVPPRRGRPPGRNADSMTNVERQRKYRQNQRELYEKLLSELNHYKGLKND